MSFNINKFVKGSNEYTDHDLNQEMVIVTETIDETKKKKSKKKNEGDVVPGTAPIIAATSMSYIQENIPYAGAYADILC